MKILFYLPLARRWMLENVLEPMIAKLAPVAEVHIIIPSTWMEKRSVSDVFQGIVSHENVTWHPITLDCVDFDTFDVNGPTSEVVDLVSAIAPDHCLCRSANPILPQRFPGQVRYIMEAGAPPFRVPRHWISLQPQIFDHGFVPDLLPHLQDALVAMISPAWKALETNPDRDSSWLRQHALPTDRKIVALPLEYDHPDNLFQVHRSICPNSELVSRLLDRVALPLFLAVTDHPLNIHVADQRNLRATLKAQHAKARLFSPLTKNIDMTSALTQHADGMIVGDSKSFAAAAFYGKPLLRISTFATGSWLKAYTDLDEFAVDLAADCAAAPALRDAMLWFAHYLAAQIFAPLDADVTSDELLERIAGTPNPNRWNEGIARIERIQGAGAEQAVIGQEESMEEGREWQTFVQPGILTGPSVMLVPLQESHREPLREAAQLDQNIWTYFPRTFNGAGDDFDPWFDHSLKLQADGEHYPFAVIRNSDGSVLGTTRFYDMAEFHQRLAIGSTWYVLEARGSLVNAEVRWLSLSHAFETWQVNRVEFITDPRNLASLAAMKLLGAAREGVIRSHLVYKDGRVRDSVVYSILKEEWPRVRERLISTVGPTLAEFARLE